MIGFIAAACTTFSFVPQAIQVIKSKDVSGISLGMYIFFVLGLFLWILHGIIVKDIALICSNVITIVLASVILFYKIKYR